MSRPISCDRCGCVVDVWERVKGPRDRVRLCLAHMGDELRRSHQCETGANL